ncbi:hypothetical protein Goshw_005160 [Gossypium schwendimanii]|uniref:DUF7745 domain-containing protein n=1 Tax=Gossypium schwendimanii TaxID=34291 RepID=A0A7J9MZJ9_GOSSC|nr:hypothetical protein [Gossypium schwendimanii]
MQIKKKGDSKCIPWKSLKDLILTHPDVRKRVDVFALSIYGLVIFPKALGYVDEPVTNLFDRLDKRVTPIPAILVETFRLLNACRKAGEGRFIGCTQLLLAWFHSHFWEVDKVPLLGIWGAIGYAPLLVLRQYRSRKRIQEISSAWKQTRRMKRLAVGLMTTPEYNEWWVRRINDNIPKSGKWPVNRGTFASYPF